MKQHLPSRRAPLAALVASLLVSPLALAAIVPAPNLTQQDIFLTVRANGGQGDTVSYLVNLGSYYQYAPSNQIPPSLQSTFSGATPGSTFTLNVGNIGSDLTRLYGADWNDRTDLVWGVVGTNNSANRSFLISNERIGGNDSVPFATGASLTNRDLFGGGILSVLTGVNGYQNREATLDLFGPGTGSAVATQQSDPSADSPGKEAYINHQATNSFGGSLGNVDYEASFGSDASLDLWRYSPNTGITNAGYFAFDETGALSFTAVPEPSISMLAVAGSLAFATKRRRNP